MKKNKATQIIFLFLLLISFTGCDTILDCITAIKPNLIYKELNSGTFSHSYSDNVNFEMMHANNNDYLISDVSIEGNFPPNLNYTILDNNMIHFSGIPNAPGTYEFMVKITVRPYRYNDDGTDDMCSDTDSKQYKIIIN